MTTEQQEQNAGGTTENGQPQVQEHAARDATLRSYGVTVRKLELRDPARRTTFDVIVHTGTGRWNAEMVAQFIRSAFRRHRPEKMRPRPRCAQCGFFAEQVIHDPTWSGAHDFVSDATDSPTGASVLAVDPSRSIPPQSAVPLLSPSVLTELREKAEKATRGEWRLELDSCDCGGEFGCSHEDWPHQIVAPARQVAYMPGNPESKTHAAVIACDLQDATMADAEFIAACSPDVILALLADLTRSGEEREAKSIMAEIVDSLAASVSALTEEQKDHQKAIAIYVEENRRLAADLRAARSLTRTRPFAEWHEDDGAALWWKAPVQEPPFSGTPGDSDWPFNEEDEMVLWWTPLNQIANAVNEAVTQGRA
jgi:hypothetical protein